jgi:hypothetical protein
MCGALCEALVIVRDFQTVGNLEGNAEPPTQCLVCLALDFMARAIYGTPAGGLDAAWWIKAG